MTIQYEYNHYKLTNEVELNSLAEFPNKRPLFSAGSWNRIILSPFSYLFGKAHSGFQAGVGPNYFL